MKERIVWLTKRADEQELVGASILIQSFQSESARRSNDANYYRWKLLENPFGEGAMWIIQDKSQVVGTASFTPKRLRIGSQTVFAAEIADTFTQSNYQRKGIFSTLVNSVRDDAFNNSGISFIYGTPNKNSLPGYEKKLNFPQIPGVGIVSLVRPLKMERVAISRVGDTWKAKVFSIGMCFFYSVWYRPRKTSKAVQVKIIDTFPPEADWLWSVVASMYDVLMVRDSAYLEWRFLTNPDEYTIWSVRDSQQLVGYIVTKPGLWRGLKVLYIADYLMLPGEESVFDEALTAILQYAQSQKMDMINCWCVGTSEFARLLRKRGFLRFKDVSIICYANELGNRVINANYKWHFTMADSDNI